MRLIDPGKLPQFSILCDDLGNFNAPQLARYFDVSTRTINAWKASDACPRAAGLALFQQTKWGASLTSTTLQNDAMWQRNYAKALEKENLLLRVRIARLEKFGDFGSANSSFYAENRLAAPVG